MAPHLVGSTAPGQQKPWALLAHNLYAASGLVLLGLLIAASWALVRPAGTEQQQRVAGLTGLSWRIAGGSSSSSRALSGCPAAQPAGQPQFYLITFEEAEAAHPVLRTCGLTIYAEMAYVHFLHHPLRSLTFSGNTSLVVFPTYHAWEINWPWYGVQINNFVRAGAMCTWHADKAAAAMLDALSNSSGGGSISSSRQCRAHRVLVMDGHPWYSPTYNMTRELEQDDRIIYFKLNALTHMWRPALDISMPSPPARPMPINASAPAAAKVIIPLPNLAPEAKATIHTAAAGMTSLAGGNATTNDTKLYFATFKGNFDTHPVRSVLGKLHDPASGVVVVHQPWDKTVKSEADAYDYTQLLTRTEFALAPRGHERYSYRFIEAVCSGAIPVLVAATDWVVPYSERVPFESYGVSISENDAPKTIEILRRIDAATRARLRARAAAACLMHFESLAKQWDTMLSIAFDKQAAATRACCSSTG